MEKTEKKRVFVLRFALFFFSPEIEIRKRGSKERREESLVVGKVHLQGFSISKVALHRLFC